MSLFRSDICRAALGLLLTALLFAGTTTFAEAGPSVELSPSKVGPGDIMTVTVTGAKSDVTGKFGGQTVYFNPSIGSQRAVVGIDLYTRPGTYRLFLNVDGSKITKRVRVSKKTYPLQRLTLPPDKVTLSPEDEARTDREAKLISALWPVDSIRCWNGGFLNPLPGHEIGTAFGVRRIINGEPKSSHSGMDVSGEEGDPVIAPNDGVVVMVGDHFYGGNSLFLDHGQGIYTMFFHLSKIDVKPGQTVLKGETIAHVGSTGRSTGPHLHWGVRMQGARVDPVQLINLKLE